MKNQKLLYPYFELKKKKKTSCRCLLQTWCWGGGVGEHTRDHRYLFCCCCHGDQKFLWHLCDWRCSSSSMPELIHPTCAYTAQKQKGICLWRHSCDTLPSVSSTTSLRKTQNIPSLASLRVFTAPSSNQKPLQPADVTQALLCLVTDILGPV